MPFTAYVSGGQNHTCSMIPEVQVLISVTYGSIPEALIYICSELFLVISDPVQGALLDRSPGIDHILLKQPSTQEEGRLHSWSWVKAICIVAPLADLCTPPPAIRSRLCWNSIMPAILPMWEEQNIVQRRVGGMQMAYPLQATTCQAQNYVSVV